MKRILLSALLSIAMLQGQGQQLGNLGNVDEIFRMYANDQTGGASDAARYLQGYMRPALNGLGFGVTGGWFNSAKTHKPGGFDLTATVTLAVVPDADKAFSMANANTVDVVGGTEVPTIMGSDTPPSFALKPAGVPVFDGLPGFGTRLEDGIGFAVIPTPMVQAGIGLPKNIELKIRYIPKIDIDGLSMNMWGFGVLHDIKQYIPGLKLAPFELSAFVGFNKMQLVNEFNSNISRNGEINFGFNSFTYQAVISKEFSILTVYGAVGAANTKMNLKINGEFDIDDNTQNGYELLDPIDIDLPAFGGKFSLGFRLKLAILSIHADYTLQKYNAMTVGVGFTVR